MQVDRSAAEGVAEIMNGAGGHTPAATVPPRRAYRRQEKLRVAEPDARLVGDLSTRVIPSAASGT